MAEQDDAALRKMYPTMFGGTAKPHGPPAGIPEPGPAPTQELKKEQELHAQMYPSMVEKPIVEGATPGIASDDGEGSSSDISSDAPDFSIPLELEMPEGWSVDNEAIREHRVAAHELGIPSEKFAKLVERYIASEAKAQTSQRAGWVKAAREDPSLTGGVGFERNVQVADAVLRQYGDEELRGVLNQSGLSSHRAMVRLLSKVGADIKHLVTKA